MDAIGWAAAEALRHGRRSSDNLMLAGGRSDSLWAFSHYAIARYDGANWTVEDNPVSAKWSGGTVAVFALADSRYRVDRLNDGGPWQVWRNVDGGAWEALGTIDNNEIRAIWASGPNDVHVIGSGGMAHYDGTGWSSEAVPAGGEMPGEDFSGTSKNQVWVLLGGTTVCEYNGMDWTKLTFEPDPGVDLSDQDCGLSAWTDRPEHGFIGCIGSVVEVDGNHAILHKLGDYQWIAAIAGTASDLVAVGTSTYHYNGSSWKEEASGVGASMQYAWYDPTAGDVWAAGMEGIVRRKAH